MNIKTYTAKDMRSALRRVREEQGPDAVILSTRHLPEGVEVTVAIEAGLDAADDASPQDVVYQSAAATPTATAPAAMAPTAVTSTPVANALAASMFPAVAPAVADPRIGDELRGMRHLLEWQLSQLAWNDLTRRAPAAAELLKELTTVGISAPLAAELTSELPDGIAFEDAQRRVLAQLARRLAVTGDELLDRGGRVVFVGPTGVGKTTGIAKLAARWVMRHGTRHIALVSLDDQRFGAEDVEFLVVADDAVEAPVVMQHSSGAQERHLIVHRAIHADGRALKKLVGQDVIHRGRGTARGGIDQVIRPAIIRRAFFPDHKRLEARIDDLVVEVRETIDRRIDAIAIRTGRDHIRRDREVGGSVGIVSEGQPAACETKKEFAHEARSLLNLNSR